MADKNKQHIKQLVKENNAVNQVQQDTVEIPTM